MYGQKSDNIFLRNFLSYQIACLACAKTSAHAWHFAWGGHPQLNWRQRLSKADFFASLSDIFLMCREKGRAECGFHENFAPSTSSDKICTIFDFVTCRTTHLGTVPLPQSPYTKKRLPLARIKPPRATRSHPT